MLYNHCDEYEQHQVTIQTMESQQINTKHQFISKSEKKNCDPLMKTIMQL